MQAAPSLTGLALLAAAACCAGTGRAGDAVTWLDATAERPVDHAVMVRGPFASGHGKTTLVGPVGLVSVDEAPGAAPCFTAYRIVAPPDEPARTVGVGAATRLRLGPAEFLLVPAKRLADGPAAAADTAAVYEVRPILDPPDAIEGLAGAGRRPTHVGLPTDYRHHFERVPVTDPDRGLVVFAAAATDAAPAAIPIVDDFGTNRLVPGRTFRAGAWTAVRAGGAP